MGAMRRGAATAVRWIHLGVDRTLFAAIRAILIGAIRVYRLTVSPLLGPTCRFHPSCSAYGLEAITVHGSAKGVVLTGWRLLRCNPWNLGGIDPVPTRGHWRPGVDRLGRPIESASASEASTAG
jgi:putative membrane protein insertion efficiency factor